ncbi:MAG: chitobiase/beta-hexosaminidase C-terminal domain-containing protein [Lachnospiraceae bacterium]
MICPNCKSEIAEGYLYCECCGEEIKLVPEYEIQVENSMDENMKELLDEVVKKEEVEERDLQRRQYAPIKTHNQIFLVCCILLVLAFIVGVCIVNIVTFRYNSAEVQHQIAENAMERGAFSEAIEPLERAIALEYENMDYKLELANIQWALGNKTATIEVLVSVMNSSYAVDDDKIDATNIIIEVYGESNDYESIHQFIMEYNMDVYFPDKVSLPVTFQQAEGTYTETIPLKLSASGNGVIYYTLDGSIPTTDSVIYTGPIYLEKGEYLVTAIYENEYGILSTAVSKRYMIDTKNPYPPEVNVFSGVYDYPIVLEAESLSEVDIYYTTDGTVPSKNSTKYIGAIYVPDDINYYRFIAVNSEGDVSSSLSREITVRLGASVTSDNATDVLVQYCIDQGVIINENGHITQEALQWHVYEYLYPVTIEGAGDCYVFAEVIREVDKDQQRTGTYYAVNIYTADVYLLEYQYNVYSLK